MSSPASFEEIANRINARRAALSHDYGLRRIGVFGSYARGEQHPGSDVDLLIEFEEPIGLFRFQRLERELAELLDTRVDLVTAKALKPRMGERILREVRDV